MRVGVDIGLRRTHDQDSSGFTCWRCRLAVEVLGLQVELLVLKWAPALD